MNFYRVSFDQAHSSSLLLIFQDHQSFRLVKESWFFTWMFLQICFWKKPPWTNLQSQVFTELSFSFFSRLYEPHSKVRYWKDLHLVAFQIISYHLTLSYHFHCCLISKGANTGCRLNWHHFSSCPVFKQQMFFFCAQNWGLFQGTFQSRWQHRKRETDIVKCSWYVSFRPPWIFILRFRLD